MELSVKLLEDYIIVLVGVPKHKIKVLSKNIIGIPFIESAEELERIYSTANIFVNPSVEETASHVTAEALACGTPAIVLASSGVRELVNDKNGIVLRDSSADKFMEAIYQRRSTPLKGRKSERVYPVYRQSVCPLI